MEKTINHLIGGAIGGFLFAVIILGLGQIAGLQTSPGILLIMGLITENTRIIVTVVYSLFIGMVLSLLFMLIGKRLPGKNPYVRYAGYGIVWWLIISIIPGIFIGLSLLPAFFSLIGWIAYGIVLGFFAERVK